MINDDLPCHKSLVCLILLHCKKWRALLLFALFLASVTTLFSEALEKPQQEPDLGLTTEEKNWILEHPKLRVGVDPAYAPFEFMDQSGRYAGMSADYMKLITKHLGVEMEIPPDIRWDTVLNKLKTRDLDVSPALLQTDERKEYLLFTQPYIKYSIAVVTRHDHSNVELLSSLAGKKVALIKIYAFSSMVLKTEPRIIPVYVDTILDGLSKLSNHEADAIICDLPSLSYKIAEFNFPNLKVAGIAPIPTDGLRIGVRKDWPILIGILEKALRSISPEEHQQIRKRWITLNPPERVDIDLTLEERDWLVRHPVIRNGIDPDWAPIEFLDEQGFPSGISSEYLNLLGQLLNVKFEYPKGMSWSQIMEALNQGSIDMVSCISSTSQREKFMDFTDPYISMPTAIFTRMDVNYVDISSLVGRTVAAVEGYSMSISLMNSHPEIKIRPVKNLRSGLDLLSKGEVFAYIDALAVGSYGITRYNYKNIRVSGEAPFLYDMSMGVSKKNPQLASILRKAIRAIPEADHARYYRKWSTLGISNKPDYLYLGLTLSGAAVLILIFAYWNRRLSFEIRRRRLVETKLRQAKEELEQRVDERTVELATRNLTLAEEILERKRAEEALKANEERYRLISDMSGQLIYDYTIKNGQINWAGKIEIITGYSPDELGQNGIKKWKSFIHPMDQPSVTRLYETARDGHMHFIAEYRLQQKNGNCIQVVDQAIFFYDEAGEAIRMIGAIRDETDQKNTESEKAKLQEQLQQAMKMEVVGRLAGGVAHDFNNLLTAIIGNVELAKMDVDASNPLSQYLDEIHKASESAASLTRQLLAFSRRQIIEPKILNLNDLVANMRKMLVRLIGENIQFRTVLEEKLNSVKVDPGQFEQVLVNLSVNARDAMLGGGKLIVETSNADIDETFCGNHTQIQPGKYVLLSISDTGHGMTAEVKKHLFEPFFTTKSKGRGTGLGLATIFGIVRQAGGVIDVYSETGLGTTFKIYLPATEQRAEKFPINKPVLELPKGNETILLVEDEASVRSSALLLLERLGYQVFTAANGSEALALLSKVSTKIDLLLTDVVMPGMNGRELAERILKSHPNMKIIFTSGYAEDLIIHQGVVQGNLNFIGKPYSMPDLARKIRMVMEASVPI